MMLFIYLYDV
jgi:hypothetical protein